MPYGSRSLGPRNKTFVDLPTLSQVQHLYNTMLICEFVVYLYMSLWLILQQCKWMRLNKHHRIRLCSQKFATWKSLRLRSKNTSWCRIGKMTLSENSSFQDPDLLFSTPSTNLFRELQECVLLCFIKPILGNRYGPGVSSCQQTSDPNLGVAGSSPSTLTTSLAIPIPSSSSSNGPSN